MTAKVFSRTSCDRLGRKAASAEHHGAAPFELLEHPGDIRLRACGATLVCPIKGTATFQIEAGVVSMTGQDAVLDAAPFKREAHVRATIVEGEDATAVVDNKDRTMTAVHNEPTLRL